VTTVLLGVGVLVFALGFVGVFTGARVHGRVAGLATMAAGVLLALAAADPTSVATWWMLLSSAATLVGLLAFALVLERRIAAEGDERTALDDDPTR
jgi:hypothetical protein